MPQKIDITIITYNRLNHIKRTLDSLFAESSPVRDYEMTILDNCSTDGTGEFLEKFSECHKNLKVIHNIRNIGGNANICRAYETSLARPAEYMWVLCDDDFYDFSAWNEVERKIEEKTDVICVCNYALPEKFTQKQVLPYLPIQCSFVPAGIYKKSILTDSVMSTMYDSIFTMFQQDILVLDAINMHKSIYVVKNEIVHNGVFDEKNDADYSYTRGLPHVLRRRNDTNWILGFANVITYLNDEQLQKEAMNIALNSKCIFLHGISDFLNAGIKSFVENNGEHYLEEIKAVVDEKTKKQIDEKIKEFKKLLGKEHKGSFYLKKKDFKSRLKRFIKKYFPRLFAVLNKLKNKILRKH